MFFTTCCTHFCRIKICSVLFCSYSGSHEYSLTQPTKTIHRVCCHYKNPCCQLEKSHSKFNYKGSTQCIFLGWNTVKYSQVFNKYFHSLGSCTENVHLYIFHPSYLSLNQFWGMNARVFSSCCASARHAVRFVWWAASFWLRLIVAEDTVHGVSSARFPTKPTEKLEKACYKAN